MKRKFSISVIIFFAAFMLNVSAMAFQQRYDRREDDEDFDPFVIEMTDHQVLKYLKNTWFFDVPLKQDTLQYENYFYNDALGFGNKYTVSSKPFLSCRLKFVLIDYIGFYSQRSNSTTCYMNFKSG
ncbi:MAG: hypothetical protein K8S16_21080 [Bacteroidales bacterium]|nr:hypothetical protein [Bacteroidales bacterium]